MDSSTTTTLVLPRGARHGSWDGSIYETVWPPLPRWSDDDTVTTEPGPESPADPSPAPR